MGNELKVVDIFIGTTLRGSAKGSGRVMYIMRTKRKNGSDYEAAPQIVEYDNTTESESVLRAIRDALQRLHYACTVVIHTECSNVAAPSHSTGRRSGSTMAGRAQRAIR